jgi:ferredoxin
MRVEVHAPRCISSGHCALLAPEVFDQREEDGVVVLLNETPASELHDAVRESAMLCPVSAIGLRQS